MSGGRSTAPPFKHLVHADWSSRPQGRWMATASHASGRWRANGPRLVDLVAPFVDTLFVEASSGAVLAGFDFPIGLPERYAERTGLDGFRAALGAFGSGEWAEVFRVAEAPGDVGLRRPFYPLRPGRKGTVRQRHLLDGHGSETMADLTRRCERRPPGGGRAASSMFWTLGAASVGRAAIHGWQEVIVPALRRDARLWPFDGALSELASSPVTLAETYPGDAYGQIGFPARGWSKMRQPDRQRLGRMLFARAEEHRVEVDDDTVEAISDGFGPRHGVDNGFDALVGLLAMIGVVDGRRPEGAPDDRAIRRWEGWILGRQP